MSNDRLIVMSNPVEIIRQKPGVFLDQEDQTPEGLASCIVFDALREGCKRVACERTPNEWWLISAERNWLQSGSAQDLTIPQLFSRMVLLDETVQFGPTRHEVFVSALCRDVVVCVGQTMYRLQGAVPEPNVALPAIDHTVVAFRR
jgi:hypothetical protein